MGSIGERPALQHVPATSGKDAIISALRADGAVVIKSFLKPAEVALFNEELDRALLAIEPGTKLNDDRIAAFHGKNTKRMTNLVTKSPFFRTKILDNDLIHEICAETFTKDSGSYWMNTSQVIDIGPNSPAQPLHRDQNQYLIFTTTGPDSHEATINFFMALTKFTEENGATRILPGSHRWADMLSMADPSETIPCEMEAGDIALFSGKTIHGGGANVTKNEWRRGLALSMQASYLTPEEAYAFMVPRSLVDTMTPRMQRMIGYRSQYPKNSPGLWMSDYRELADVLGLVENA